MAAHGIEAVDCYCVDNALVRTLLLGSFAAWSLLCWLGTTLHLAHRLLLSLSPLPACPLQVRLADPTWVGFCHSRGIECGESLLGCAGQAVPATRPPGSSIPTWLASDIITAPHAVPSNLTYLCPAVPPLHNPLSSPLPPHRRARGGQGVPRGEGGRVCAPRRRPGGRRVLGCAGGWGG